MRLVPSDTAVPLRSSAPRSQRLRIPAWHDGHVPQDGMKDSTTWSPGSRPSTPAPTSVTMPAPSWPPSTGKPPIGMPPVTKVMVGVAHPRRFHLDLDLVLDGIADLDLLDRPRLVELPDQRTLR